MSLNLNLNVPEIADPYVQQLTVKKMNEMIILIVVSLSICI